MSAAIPPIINSVPLLITMSKSHYYLRFLFLSRHSVTSRSST